MYKYVAQIIIVNFGDTIWQMNRIVFHSQFLPAEKKKRELQKFEYNPLENSFSFVGFWSLSAIADFISSLGSSNYGKSTWSLCTGQTGLYVKARAT